jgi:GNAT superfamily N-acetyltransferase
VIIRSITPADVPLVHDFIVRLAEFEKEPNIVQMTLEQLHDALFGQVQRAEAIIADSPEGELGFCIFSQGFNTWTGRPTLQIEDVFVNEAARGQGVGRLIFHHLAGLAVARGYQRMEWSVLNWNKQAIDFYESLGAVSLADWVKYRLSGEALLAVAAKGV